ncbi:glutamate-5-semialdehyde dehydrogenase, partial [Candidatus Gottesmanbacteria bacterium]|nr:glutamate-5-semialdehyde dehydrogenase [Candidatus Gottesmanbacteria bacterium]
SSDMKLKKLLTQIKRASFDLAQVNNRKKNKFLNNLDQILRAKRKKIIEANKKDIAFAKCQSLSKAFIDRLKLDEKGIDKIIQSLNNIEKMKDPTGQIIEKRRLNNGLLLQKISVPIGIILVIYESRPEVTIDVTALCIKSGNIAILKGGREALNTNKVLYKCVKEALKAANLPEQIITFIKRRDDVKELLKQNKHIDLVIARGGYEMVKRVQNMSTIPVLAHSSGGARIYVDKSADLEMAKKIIINSKISKPAACNSVDTVIVHQNIAKEFIPQIVKELRRYNVNIFFERSEKPAPSAAEGFSRNLPQEFSLRGSNNIWNTEFLDLIVSIKIVEDADSAIGFIHKYTKHHTEGIVAEERKVIDKFVNSIDAAAIFINSSTRLHDGGVFGMGAEMGISTGKLHARGPVGLKELTTYKWIVGGNGQIRE